MTDFQKELLSLINRHSKENESNTPDFIIADYLIGCLKVFSESVNNRTLWYAKSPAQPLTTDEETADKYAKANCPSCSQGRFIPCICDNLRRSYFAGCTHVRSQQPVDYTPLFDLLEVPEILRIHPNLLNTIDATPVVVEWAKNAIKKCQPQQPLDAVALLQIAVDLVDRAYKHNDKEVSEWLAVANKFVTEANALFSGSQASNQQEERDLWQEVAMIIYEHDGKLVATIDRLKERFHITAKTQQHD